MRPAPTPRVRPGLLRVLDPTAYDILAAWEAAARSTTAALSLYAGRHPLVGELTFEYETLTVPDDAGQALCLYTAQPDSPSDHTLCLLAGGSAPAHPAEDRACSSSPPSP